jgi:pyridoxine 5-phosphate synthase
VSKAVTDLRLGVNIDHVATLRNARGGSHPDPLRAADQAAYAGCDQITVHLREDRRHIRDEDVTRLLDWGKLPINLEMAATSEMIAFACSHRPPRVCLVPERREEVTTEGGLDVTGQFEKLASAVEELSKAGCTVSLFVDADPESLERSAKTGAAAVELHTGAWAGAGGGLNTPEWRRLRSGAVEAADLGLDVHAGHGLTFQTAETIAMLPPITELNIGHFLISEAVFSGLPAVLAEMRDRMARGRRMAGGELVNP